MRFCSCNLNHHLQIRPHEIPVSAFGQQPYVHSAEAAFRSIKNTNSLRDANESNPPKNLPVRFKADLLYVPVLFSWKKLDVTKLPF